MKPTKEQVIAWGREAAGHCNHGDFNMGYSYEFQPDQLQAAFTLAYEAGRKDENEACAKVCEDDCGNGALNLADAIRARREQ